jgi:hypothetical protein
VHEAIAYLTKKLEQLTKETDSVFEEVSKQAALETKALEEMEYGRSFEEDTVLLQEKIVEALQETIEALTDAQDGAREAAQVLRKLKKR